VTAGLRCAPLILPIGEYTTRVAPPANNTPVRSKRTENEGLA
jgi:hypothetical protein